LRSCGYVKLSYLSTESIVVGNVAHDSGQTVGILVRILALHNTSLVARFLASNLGSIFIGGVELKRIWIGLFVGSLWSGSDQVDAESSNKDGLNSASGEFDTNVASERHLL